MGLDLRVLSGHGPGEQQDGTAATFDAARAKFDEVWQQVLPRLTEDALQEWRDQRVMTAWKYEMHDRGLPLPAQTADGRSQCDRDHAPQHEPAHPAVALLYGSGRSMKKSKPPKPTIGRHRDGRKTSRQPRNAVLDRRQGHRRRAEPPYPRVDRANRQGLLTQA
jgi:hypothetical protein